MCGRYSVSTPAQLVEDAFAAERAAALDEELLRPRWNVAPTQEAPVVLASGNGKRRLDLLRWGLLAEGTERGGGHLDRGREPRASVDVGAQASDRGRLLINARAETVASLPAFRDAFRARRCLVPADGFYEWKREGRDRQPFHIRFADRRLFAFAGLWNPRQGDAEGHGSFTILTCPPSPVVAPLHDRMPVILPPEAWSAWLAADTDADALAALLVPLGAPALETVPVDAWVNRADHEGERCVRPVDLAKIPRQLSLL